MDQVARSLLTVSRRAAAFAFLLGACSGGSNPTMVGGSTTGAGAGSGGTPTSTGAGAGDTGTTGGGPATTSAATTGSTAATGAGTTAATGSSAATSSSSSGAVDTMPPLPAEPTIPPACTTLMANKTLAGDDLDAADESNPDTARIQAAINACPAGRSVQLVTSGAMNAFLSGPLKMAQGVTLWVDTGVTLFASRNPRDYDVTSGSCGIIDNKGSGCVPFITVAVTGVGIMGDGTIDGRGDGLLTGQTVSWWDLANMANMTGMSQNCPRLINATHADDLTLYNITLQNSPNFHVLAQSNGFIAWGVKINTPSRATSPSGKALTPLSARNTDGIDPSASTNVTIAYCYINDGDDHVAIKGGGPVSHVTVAHNHFYSGHGMSIGSETNGGVSDVNVYDLTIDMMNYPSGSPDGLRIKSDDSRGGLVTGVNYTDVCMRDVADPIVLTTQYSAATGSLIPTFQNITFTDVHSTQSSASSKAPALTFVGADATRLLAASFTNVVIDGIDAGKITASYAALNMGPDPVNFMPSGTGVTVTSKLTGNAAANACDGRFVPFPVR